MPVARTVIGHNHSLGTSHTVSKMLVISRRKQLFLLCDGGDKAACGNSGACGKAVHCSRVDINRCCYLIAVKPTRAWGCNNRLSQISPTQNS